MNSTSAPADTPQMDSPGASSRLAGYWERFWSIRPLESEPLLLVERPLRARERRMFWVLLGVWIINLFDLHFTLIAMQQCVMTELNPLAARVLPHGETAVMLYKFGMLAVGTTILWALRKHPLAEWCAWLYAAVCVGLCLYWHHVFHMVEPNWVFISTASSILPESGLAIPPSVTPRS